MKKNVIILKYKIKAIDFPPCSPNLKPMKTFGRNQKVDMKKEYRHCQLDKIYLKGMR